MKISTEGLVVSEQTVGEFDKLITILTSKEGLVRAFVKSARNIKNKNSIPTGLLCYSDFILYKGKDKYVVDEACVKQLFFGLRNDIKKLALAQYFCEISIVLGPREENCTELLRLMLNSLYFLLKDKIPLKILKSIVEIRSISISGFMPDLVCCKKCGVYKSEIMYLNPINGNLLCSSCIKDFQKLESVFLSHGAVSAFRHVIYSDFKKIFSFELDEKSEDVLSKASETYLLTHTEHKFKTLSFYNML